MKDTLGPAVVSRLSSSRRSKNVLLLWKMIVLGLYKLSFLERLSSFQRVLYRRVCCIAIIASSIETNILFRT